MSFSRTPIRKFKIPQERKPHSSLPNIKRQLIEESLIMVPRFGFTNQTLLTACSTLSFSSSSVALITRGPVELTFFLMDEWNTQLESDFRHFCQERVRQTEAESPIFLQENLLDQYNLLFHGLKCRLGYIKPYLDHWRQVNPKDT